MKKALTTIVCVLAMLCFGFVAVGMQITTPLETARTYKEEYVTFVEDIDTTQPDVDTDDKGEESEPTEEEVAVPEAQNDDVDGTDTNGDSNTGDESETTEEPVKVLDIVVYEDGDVVVKQDNLAIELVDDVYVITGEVVEIENAERYNIGIEKEDVTTKVFVLKLTTAKLGADEEGNAVVGTIKGEATTNEFTADNFDGEDFIYLLLDGRTYEYVITYGDSTWTVRLMANAPVVEEPPVEENPVECEHSYNAEGVCGYCQEVDADDEHWNIEKTPFNRYLLNLVKLGDKEAMADGAFWYVFTEVAAIVLFAVAAFMLGLTITHKFGKKDRTPKAPKVKKQKKVKKVKEAAQTTTTTTNGPRVRW
ncbi:MAG: hypothetical protein NC218_02525 [Acetobacter sp.]|nr:hypothetical protein [Acetobacter sp.]